MTNPQRARRQATFEIAQVWLSDHIGRLAGLLLGLFAIISLCFLALVGFRPALGVLVVVVAGVALIALGGRMRGGR